MNLKREKKQETMLCKTADIDLQDEIRQLLWMQQIDSRLQVKPGEQEGRVWFEIYVADSAREKAEEILALQMLWPTT